MRLTSGEMEPCSGVFEWRGRGRQKQSQNYLRDEHGERSRIETRAAASD
ncbi:Uncharacterised protein [Afipia felis]|uniref:Uncharacterized protein n=2 Tax=Afipia felis TaxID=1035 RepID=A0A380W9Q5_AFIFE|nr:hypothetical protein HMPREF9697_01320 [Afipia felis ATCC 53690]SUU77500.1 Uncharacterised protein [Afipia felis]SUU85566.1 Uncharacterised protein [Afipia felis]